MTKMIVCNICGEEKLFTEKRLSQWICSLCLFSRKPMLDEKNQMYSKVVDPIAFICKICNNNENLEGEESNDGSIRVFCRIHSGR